MTNCPTDSYFYSLPLVKSIKASRNLSIPSLWQVVGSSFHFVASLHKSHLSMLKLILMLLCRLMLKVQMLLLIKLPACWFAHPPFVGQVCTKGPSPSLSFHPRSHTTTAPPSLLYLLKDPFHCLDLYPFIHPIIKRVYIC